MWEPIWTSFSLAFGGVALLTVVALIFILAPGWRNARDVFLDFYGIAIIAFFFGSGVALAVVGGAALLGLN
jgi:hypothetical protein